jgi:nucleotide-binding universal stress UspA family protein
MSMYRRLLVPLDGSHLAESVLPVVARLAEACGSAVVLLHIVEQGAPATVHGDRHLRTAGDATAYLAQLAGHLRAQGIAVELHIHDAPEGDVALSIARHADETGSDLIVLCAHGRGGVRGLLFGSIAQQVLRRGATPVVLVRPGQHPDTPFAPRVLLVPLDTTAAAEAALEPACALAHALRAALRLVMVVPTQGTVRGERVATTTLLPIAAQAALDLEYEDAISYMTSIEDRLRLGGTLDISATVARGDVPAVLAAAAADVGMVVVASHGLARFQTMWTRSATANLLGKPGPPVLLIRRDDDTRDT